MSKSFKQVLRASRVFIAALVLLSAQALSPIAAFLPKVSAAPVCVVDTAGPNDEPGQKDLNKLCVDYAGVPTTVATTWNWDETGTSGANTMDACNLFDTDGDGNINYAVCVTTQDDPAVLQTVTTYSCGDTKIDRCTSPATPISNGTTSCAITQVTNDPFPGPPNSAKGDSYPKDTQGACTVQLATVGGASAKLVDVCSYPSAQPNSDPSDCVIARDNSGKVELIKDLVPNADPGLFNLIIDGPGASDTTTVNNVGDNGTTGEVVVGSGSVIVKETPGTNTLLTSYNTTIICRDLNGTGSIVGQASPTGASSRQLTFTLADEADVVCIATNTRQQATLILQKTVVNDNGGTLTQSNFPVAISSNTAQWGSNTVAPGTYTVSETQQAGYIAGSWGGDCTTEGSVTLTDNQTKTCTITNDDQPGQMKVVKQVTNDNGGTAQPSDFTLSVNSEPKTQDQYFNVNVGTYTVTESGPSGYTQTGIACVNDANQQVVSHPVSIGLGQSVTCTVTNNDDAASLTVIKHVINNSGGTKVASDFTMLVNGTNVSSASFAGAEYPGTTVTLDAGSYSVGETGPGGYFASFSDDCDGSLVVGQHKTCTITNNDIAPILTVTKYVTNDNGGTKEVGDFKLFVGDTQVVSGEANAFLAAVYQLSELNLTGYTASDWNGDCSTSGNITLEIGGNYNCSITNNDQPGILIVKKVVINDNGGTKEASDFSFSVNSGDPVSFENDGQNDLTVNSGSYDVTEPGVTGYATSYDNCSQVYVVNGGTQTCTITNNDIAPSLTIVKQASPESDQQFNFTSAKLGDFSLVDDGTSTDTKQFNGLNADTYSVIEASTQNWGLDAISCSGTRDYSTDGSTLSVTLTVGDEVTCTFSNSKDNQIDGYKFNDLNGNGAWDTNEPTLEGWTITLAKPCDILYESLLDILDECVGLNSSTTTNQDGYYSFTDLEAGTYTVCEELQVGWIQTYPSYNNGCHIVEIEGDGQVVSKDFGNFKKGTIEGVKFNDKNGNGQRDQGESTLTGWLISLYEQAGDDLLEWLDVASQTATTDSNGSYSFTNLLPGSYKVCETQQTNWERTYPTSSDCHIVSVNQSGQVITADFGNKTKPQILSTEILVKTGTSTPTSMQIVLGLSLLTVVGALQFLSLRNKQYSK